MKQRLLAFAFLVLAASLGLTKAGTAQEGGKNSDQAGQTSSAVLMERNPRYHLRAGDTFDVDFALTPEFNQSVTVQPDGFGSFKAVGSFPVANKTIPELTESIRTAYANVLHDPIVVIVLKDFEKPYFIAAGQVSKPGEYDMRSDLSITEAVAIAGGFNDKGKRSEVILYRRSPTGAFEGKVFNIKKLLASRDLSEDPLLRPGDIVYVPQSRMSYIRPYLPTMSAGAFFSPSPWY